MNVRNAREMPTVHASRFASTARVWSWPACRVATAVPVATASAATARSARTSSARPIRFAAMGFGMGFAMPKPPNCATAASPGEALAFRGRAGSGVLRANRRQPFAPWNPRRWSSCRSRLASGSHRVAHSRHDILGTGPGFTHELGEQPTFSRNYGLTVDNDFELSAPTVFNLDGRIQGVTDQGSETRRLSGNGASGVAADDSYIHGREYSSADSELNGSRSASWESRPPWPCRLPHPRFLPREFHRLSGDR